MAGIAIGELSVRTKVKIPTIRYYEEVGLLNAPTRTEGRQRRYGDDDIERLDFIRNARELGFEVNAIRELMDLGEDRDGSGAEKDAVLQRHLDAVQSRIDRLLSLREALQGALSPSILGGTGESRVIRALHRWRQDAADA